MKNLVFLVIFAILSTLHASDYFMGFTETLGIENVEEVQDCGNALHRYVKEFEGGLHEQDRDIEALVSTITNIIERLKFDLKSQCRLFFGDFEIFMGNYIGETEQLRSIIIKNMDTYHNQVLSAMVESFHDAHGKTDPLEAGRLHAYILRVLVGIETPDHDEDEESDSLEEGLKHLTADRKVEDDDEGEPVAHVDYNEYLAKKAGKKDASDDEHNNLSVTLGDHDHKDQHSAPKEKVNIKYDIHDIRYISREDSESEDENEEVKEDEFENENETEAETDEKSKASNKEEKEDEKKEITKKIVTMYDNDNYPKSTYSTKFGRLLQESRLEL